MDWFGSLFGFNGENKSNNVRKVYIRGDDIGYDNNNDNEWNNNGDDGILLPLP